MAEDNNSIFGKRIEADTPMMKQFKTIKEKYPDAILLFRCGDFYETYFDDAIVTAKILNITLTKRNNGTGGITVDMAGFPFHALDNYLPKLVRAGKRIAICDQLEDPKLTKKLVKRDVTELITPAVSYSDATLPKQECNFLACVYEDKNRWGISLLDISTGEFLTGEGDENEIDKLLVNFAPKETLIPKGTKEKFCETFGSNYFVYELDSWIFTYTTTLERITKQFNTQNLKGFGIENFNAGVITAGVILHYLDITQHLETSHINHIARIEKDKYVWLDKFTIRNLELINGLSQESHTLYEILNHTITPMGERLLRRWIVFPLKEPRSINNRLSVVNFFYHNPDCATAIATELEKVQDMERVVGKISTARISPRDLAHLAIALNTIPAILKIIHSQTASPFLTRMGEQLLPLEELKNRIKTTISPTPPAVQGKPNTIQDNVNTELDELRSIQRDGKTYLQKMQESEIEKTGIQSLKIGFNKIFGYYFEVRNTYKNQVPHSWIRKQTLVDAERYVTEELKAYEEKILNAEERILALENRIFAELVNYAAGFLENLQTNANVLAQLDCLLNFASIAHTNHYVLPNINENLTIEIKQGRHPVIEKNLPLSEYYVPNDVLLSNNEQQIIILTGPNMAGKSALLRQTALIVLMAQMGSFVPANSASIGVVDKIFTRVGAGDNISVGESTFMSEMTEAASILNNLSERSLVLFDELGRGTSTYDGISIAWAIIEYLHENKLRPKVFFATHYHELNTLQDKFCRVHNFNVSVQENNGKIIFLRKMIPGGSEHSFGIHVAKLAGLPTTIINKANQILKELETNAIHPELANNPSPTNNTNNTNLEKIKETLDNLSIDTTTPLEALQTLQKLKLALSNNKNNEEQETQSLF